MRAAAAFGERLDHSAFGFRSDNDLAQLAAIRAGVGVGPGHEIVMRRDADLINVLPEFKATLEVWLATPPALRGTARVAITLDALAKGFRNLTIRDIHG